MKIFNLTFWGVCGCWLVNSAFLYMAKVHKWVGIGRVWREQGQACLDYARCFVDFCLQRDMCLRGDKITSPR